VNCILNRVQPGGFDLHYTAFFDCFNRQHYFEAHEVLEELWLKRRCGSEGLFYKGLIQLAGAFVHVGRNRPGPAQALFRLARANLERYPTQFQGLDVSAVVALIERWLELLAKTAAPAEVLVRQTAPVLALFTP
jgi:predicted metal-dependent hydrolase